MDERMSALERMNLHDRLRSNQSHQNIDSARNTSSKDEQCQSDMNEEVILDETSPLYKEDR